MNAGKKKGHLLCTATVIVAALLGLVWALGRLVMPKYASGITEGALIGSYYEAKEPHDVIALGDCEAYEAISPLVLFRDYGVSSFVRGTAQQLIWQSECILEETLSYETPRAVVLTVCGLKYGEPQKEAYNRMTLDGMRLSRYKIKGALAGMAKEENLLSYLFPLLRYHERITELTKEDFTYFFSRPDIGYNGFLPQTAVKPYTWLPTDTGTAEDLPDNCMQILTEMALLCREKGIALILVKSPCLFPYWYERWDNQLTAFAEEYGAVYLNANDFEAETGIDWSTDTSDGGAHLNIYGAEKYTRWLYEKALAALSLPDRRTEKDTAAVYAALTEKYNREIAGED